MSSFESLGVRYLVLGLEEKNQAKTIVVSYKELFPILRNFFRVIGKVKNSDECTSAHYSHNLMAHEKKHSRGYNETAAQLSFRPEQNVRY